MTNIGVFFDLDKTILASSTSYVLRKALIKHGITTRAKTFLNTMSQLQYLLFGANDEKTERMKDKLAELSKGIDTKALEKATEISFTNYVKPNCYTHILDLIEIHKALNHNIVIASASTEEVVKPIAKNLGIKHYLGTQLEIENGQYTGKVHHFLYSDMKAKAVRKLAEENGWDLEKSYAYSDSITDLPLLETVGNPRVVNPDKELRIIAKIRNWEIIETKNIMKPKKITSKNISLITIATLTVATITYLIKKKR